MTLVEGVEIGSLHAPTHSTAASVKRYEDPKPALRRRSFVMRLDDHIDFGGTLATRIGAELLGTVTADLRCCSTSADPARPPERRVAAIIVRCLLDPSEHLR